MATQKGRLLLIKIGDGGGTEAFATLAGIQSRDFTITNNTADNTRMSTSSPGDKVPTSSVYGIQSVSFSGNGIFDEVADVKSWVADVWDHTDRNYEITVPGDGTYTGQFRVTNLQYGGDTEGDMTFSASWESSGAITRVAESL